MEFSLSFSLTNSFVSIHIFSEITLVLRSIEFKVISSLKYQNFDLFGLPPRNSDDNRHCCACDIAALFRRYRLGSNQII